MNHKLDNLPTELIHMILLYINDREYSLSLGLTCKRIYDIHFALHGPVTELATYSCLLHRKFVHDIWEFDFDTGTFVKREFDFETGDFVKRRQLANVKTEDLERMAREREGAY